MKTRTLLLLSVGVGLMILLAGGVFFLQLLNETETTGAVEFGEEVEVGDVHATVFGADETSSVLSVDVEVGGIDDSDGIASFVLLTGVEDLLPIAAPADGRCAQITEAMQTCRIDFDVSAVEGPNRALVLDRGDERRRWNLAGA
ncbi:MAG: hypothetical protein WBP59_05350 [Ilumatobacteraceae bacterium]